ncbi:MAG: lipopolysaccharide biosynthesis protein [Nitrospira sp.]|nr:lipopolysaccharide biosynthesis protein [Nitrospira sp.]
MSLKTCVLQNLLWAFAQTWGSKCVSFITFFLIARVLSPSEIGIVATVAIFIVLLELVVEQGFGDAIVQKERLTDVELNSAFVFCSIVGVVMGGLLWIGAPAMAVLWEMPALSDVARALCFSLPITALGICPQAVLRKHLEYKTLAVRLLVSTAVSGLLGICLAIAGYGVWSLVAQVLSMSLLNTLMVWMKVPWCPSVVLRVQSLGDLYRYGLNVTVSKVLHFFSVRYVELLVSFFLGIAALGVFSVALRIYHMMLQLLSLSMLDISLSMFSAIRRNLDHVRRTYRKAVALSALITIPSFLIVGTLSTEICLVSFGEKWGDAGEVLFYLSILGSIQSVENLNVSLLKAFGRADLDLRVNFAKAVAVTIGFLASYRFGLTAVVAALLTAMTVVTPLSYYYVYQVSQISMREVIEEVWGSLISAIGACGIVVKIKPYLFAEKSEPVLVVISLLAVAVIVYGLLVSVLARRQLAVALEVLARRRPSRPNLVEGVL